MVWTNLKRWTTRWTYTHMQTLKCPCVTTLSHLLQAGSTKRDINESKYLKSYLSLSYGFSIDGNNYSGFKVNISSDEKRHKMPMILHDNEMTPL